MEFKSFKKFTSDVIKRGLSLQKKDIRGQDTTKSRLTNTQVFSLLLAPVVVCLTPKGFSDNFAGFTIGFLGIFVGLFTSIIISLNDKSKSIFSKNSELDQIAKQRLLKIKNHLVQFTGLTSFAILLAFFIVILLSVVLLSPENGTNIYSYQLVDDFASLGNLRTWFNFLVVTSVVIHRLLVIVLLFNFFSVTIYSLSSYFEYLQDEYKRIKIK